MAGCSSPSCMTAHAAVDELGHRFRRRGLEHDSPAAAIHDVRGAGAEPPCPGAPAPGEHSIVQPDQQLAIPPEGHIVRASQDEAHGVAVAANEGGVFLPRLGRAVSGEDPVDLLEGDGNALHRRGCGDRLRFEVAPQATRPGSPDRSPVVELGSPAIQLIQLGMDGIWSEGQQHEWILSLIT